MITLAQALASGSGVERKFTCPAHRDLTPSASVNVAKGVWYCYTCHAHGRVDGSIVADAYDGEPETFEASMRSALIGPAEDFYPESWLDQFDAGLPCEYWCARFEPQTVSHFRLGYDAIRDAATYPLRTASGQVLGVVRRSLVGGSKYRYPVGTRTSDLLFNYEASQVPIVLLTEGATDAMALWEAGFRAETGCLALATFSNRISAAQIALLARLDPSMVVVCYDDDEPGSAGVDQVAALLRRDYDLYRPVFAKHAKDMAEMSPAQRRASIEQAVAL